MVTCIVSLIMSIGVIFGSSCPVHTQSEAIVIVGNQQIQLEQIQSDNMNTFYAGVTRGEINSYLKAIAPKYKVVARVTSGSDNGAFLNCVRNRESRGNYTVINSTPVGREHAAGAYQFLPSTWDSVARRIGRTDLVGVNPANASPEDQDMMARETLRMDGRQPWAGPGCG